MKKIPLGVMAMVAIWAIAGRLRYGRHPDWPTRGQFGDMFGAINALFSSLALIGVVVAVWIQKEELKLQRRELEMTRSELRRTAEAQHSASESLASQLEHQKIASVLNGLS